MYTIDNKLSRGCYMSDTKHFNSATELIKYLDIGRPTFYRRAKSLGISTTKGDYTQEELDSLLKPLSNASNSTVKNEKITDETVQLLKEQLETANKTIEHQQEQLHKKDEQIEKANQIADQAQRLQSDLQNKLDSKEQQLLETKQEAKKGFWARLFS